MFWPPRGPVPTSNKPRTSSGACSVISWATKPPIEKPRHINLLQFLRLDEGDGVSTHLLERGRHLARAVANARVVEQDHLPRRREAVGHHRPYRRRGGEVE